MTIVKMLRGLAIAAALSTSGCFAQAAAPDETKTAAQDLDAVDVDPKGESANGGSAQARVRQPASLLDQAPEVRPACNACGYPVPWTPPTEQRTRGDKEP